MTVNSIIIVLYKCNKLNNLFNVLIIGKVKWKYKYISILLLYKVYY